MKWLSRRPTIQQRQRGHATAPAARGARAVHRLWLAAHAAATAMWQAIPDTAPCDDMVREYLSRLRRSTRKILDLFSGKQERSSSSIRSETTSPTYIQVDLPTVSPPTSIHRLGIDDFEHHQSWRFVTFAKWEVPSHSLQADVPRARRLRQTVGVSKASQ